MNSSQSVTAPVSLADYARLAALRADAAVWDFIAGGSESEATVAANLAAFRQWALRPRILSGVKSCDLTVELLGTSLPHPVLVAPIGYQGLAHPEAEVATARAAGVSQSLMVVSTMSNCTLEEVAEAATGPLWFQLYVMRDRGLTLSLVRRAEAARYRALVVTVDVPRFGRRERDVRNAFALPPHLRPRNLPPDGESNLHRREQGASAVACHVNHAFDNELSWDTLSWLQAQTRLPIVLKGVLTREDALRAAEVGVRGLIVSNHGGRQLDGASASLDALAEVVEGASTVCEVLLDGGIRRGTDAIKARALGARAVLIGRPILWGLLAGGIDGACDVLHLLRAEIEHALVLMGQSSWTSVDRSLLSPATGVVAPSVNDS